MAIPLANRMGQLNAPNASTGKAVSAAESISNMGQVGYNTMRLMQRASDDMGKAVIFQQRQSEQLAAQDALTEYLAGREKLDSVRDAMTLENAVAFEDKYYQEAQKMHSEFVRKINTLQYADIRERVRGQANSTNIQTAAQAENFFWKQKEQVADNHTNALVETKTRQVVNSVNSNPGMEGYNKSNIAEGYDFILDTLKTRLLEKGYRDGTPEMDVAMSKAKDDYFANVLEELSHRADNGLAMAHNMGKIFKEQMSPEQWNTTMKPISYHNLSEELQKDASRFFTGPVENMKFNMKAAEKFSVALDDAERRALLESFATNYAKGLSAEKAAVDADFSREFMTREGLRMQDAFGSNLGIVPGGKMPEELSTEESKKISDRLIKNNDPIKIMQMLDLWENTIDNGVEYYVLSNGETKMEITEAEKSLVVERRRALLKDSDKDILRNRSAFFRKMLYDNPDIASKGLKGTWFEGKDPSLMEVGIAAAMTQADYVSREPRWWEFANVFGVFGKPPVKQRNTMAAVGLQQAIRRVANEMGNRSYDSYSADEQNTFWSRVSAQIEKQTGAEYAMHFGSKDMKDTVSTMRRNMAVRDFFGVDENAGAFTNALNVVSSLTPTSPQYYKSQLVGLYYGYNTVKRTVRDVKKTASNELKRRMAASSMDNFIQTMTAANGGEQ